MKEESETMAQQLCKIGLYLCKKRPEQYCILPRNVFYTNITDFTQQVCPKDNSHSTVSDDDNGLKLNGL